MKSLKTWQRNQETDLSSSKEMLTSHNIVFTLWSLTAPCPPEAFREVRLGGNPTNPIRSLKVLKFVNTSNVIGNQSKTG